MAEAELIVTLRVTDNHNDYASRLQNDLGSGDPQRVQHALRTMSTLAAVEQMTVKTAEVSRPTYIESNAEHDNWGQDQAAMDLEELP